MRKIVCLLLGVLVFLPSYAQDTITEGDTCYSFWPHSQPLRERGTLYSDYTATPIIFEEIFTESKWVYGISVRRHYPLDSSYVVFLAKMGKDSIVSFLDTVYLDSLAVRTYLRLKIHPRIDTYTWDYNTVVDHVYQCHEIYFRRPWLMQDTFYVFFKRLFDLYTTPTNTKPKIVKPRPKTSCKEPKIQNQGPKNVHGLFLENNLIIVKVNKMIQRAAKTIKPTSKPTDT